MDFNGFDTWLKDEKGMNERSASDAASRLRRVLNITKEKEVTTETLDKLNSSKSFLSLSQCVKSQLRRAVALYIEYK